MKPFLVISTRPEDDVALTEHESVLRFTGLDQADVRWVRLEREELPDLGGDDVSGVLLCGSPFTYSDPPEDKPAMQVSAEKAIFALLDRVFAEDIPFLGACYGVGTLGTHQGAVIDRTHGEPIGAIEVTLTDAGREDPLIRAAGLGDTFTGLVGHKEAVHTLPEHAVLLATGETCPVQMFRAGPRQYATQFHPELNVPLIIDRARHYREHGYFDPEDMERIFAELSTRSADEAPKLLRAFAELFAR